MSAPERANLRFDAAALFQHCATNLGRDMARPRQWLFSCQHASIDELLNAGEKMLDALQAVLGRKPRRLAPSLSEANPTVLENGKKVLGPPSMQLEFIDVLTQKELAGLHKKFGAIARRYGIEYEGVQSYELLDEGGWERMPPQQMGFAKLLATHKRSVTKHQATRKRKAARPKSTEHSLRTGIRKKSKR